jgi:hypothetical protein
MSPEELLTGDGASPADAPQRPPSPRGAAAGAAAGGGSSNTPPSNTKFVKCLGGEDWLELSLYLQHRNFLPLKQRLDAAREASEAHNRGPDELEFAGRKFLMLPSAALAGTKEKQVVYRWRLRSEDGWWLLLMNRPHVHETLPTGIARASSLPLMRIGPTAYLRQLQETLDDLGITLVREKVSRVDACADLDEMSVEPLYHAFMRGHFVCRARNSTERIAEESIDGYRIGREPTGFDFGKGQVRFRLYDKVRKCLNDWEMLLLMQTRRWGGLGGNSAIRAEFELRREKLKALGIDSVADWRAKRGAVTHYLTHEWLRITASEVDPKHPDRAPVHPHWTAIQDAMAAWSGAPVAELEPLPRLPIRADHLLQQVVGALVSYHARVGTNIDSEDAFAHESMAAILDTIEGRDLAEEVRRRAVELGVARRQRGATFRSTDEQDA